MIKHCVICDKQFESRNRQIYCSDECRYLARIKRQNRYHQTPELITAKHNYQMMIQKKLQELSQMNDLSDQHELSELNSQIEDVNSPHDEQE